MLTLPSDLLNLIRRIAQPDLFCLSRKIVQMRYHLLHDINMDIYQALYFEPLGAILP
jgi:hypothetical protein